MLIPILTPPDFVFQWHITAQCNWYCRHCYQEDPSSHDLPFNLLISVLYQYIELIKNLDIIGPSHTRIQITGGEPLFRKDCFMLFEKIAKYKNMFSLSLLSNGGLINKENANRLQSIGVDAVQLSLEGMRQKNDAIRGRGSYQKIIRAIEILVSKGIIVTISFTLSKYNISDIPAIIRLCEKLGVYRLGIRRMVFIGRGKEFKNQNLSPLQLRKIYHYIEEENKQRKNRHCFLKAISRGCEGAIFSQETERILDNCAVVRGSVLTVLPNGDAVPCRRLPVKIGNVFKKSMTDIFYNSRIMKQLINLDNLHPVCKACPHFDICLSGARCISLNYFGKLFLPDPQCWRIFEKLPRRDFYKEYKNRLNRRKRVHYSLLLRKID